MPNASTIRRQVGGTQQLTIAPLLGTTITTTSTPFSLNNNALTLTGGGVIPLSAGVTGLYAGTGQQLWIHAAGTITGGTASSTTLIVALYVVPGSSLPLTAAQSTTIAELVAAAGVNGGGATLIGTSATGTLAAGKTTGNFSFDAYVQLDSLFNLTGEFNSQIFASQGGTSAQAYPTPLTQVLLTGEADLNFVLGAVLGGTEAGVIINLDEFSLNYV